MTIGLHDNDFNDPNPFPTRQGHPPKQSPRGRIGPSVSGCNEPRGLTADGSSLPLAGYSSYSFFFGSFGFGADCSIPATLLRCILTRTLSANSTVRVVSSRPVMRA